MHARLPRLAVAAVTATTGLAMGLTPSAQAAVATDNPVNWTPHVTDGRVLAYAVVGNKVVVGGEFNTVREPGKRQVIPRRNIFAFDIGTGKIDPNFAPKVDGVVEALAPAKKGTTVFAGGSFKKVNGSSNRGLTKLKLRNGHRVTKFKAKTSNGRVRQLVRRNSHLYVAGSFTKIRGTKRSTLARVNAKSGKVDSGFKFNIAKPRRGTLQVVGMDVNPQDSRLVIDGTFTQVDGKRRYQIAMINTRTSTLRNWSTKRYGDYCGKSWDTYMRDVAFSPDGSYFVVVTTGGRNSPTNLCDSAARWETKSTGSGSQPSWVNWTGGDSLYSVAITGSAVYVGGHMRWLNNPQGKRSRGPGAVDRPGLAALQPSTGAALPWNPGRKPLGHGTEIIVASKTAGLLTGSDTDNCGGEQHAKICAFPAPGRR